jgi:hypothetical protein
MNDIIIEEKVTTQIATIKAIINPKASIISFSDILFSDTILKTSVSVSKSLLLTSH